MGDLPSFKAILSQNWFAPFRYLSFGRKQLLWFQFVHFSGHHPQILKEVQENEFRGNDDLPAEHAHQGLARRGSVNSHRRSLRVPKLFPIQVIYDNVLFMKIPKGRK